MKSFNRSGIYLAVMSAMLPGAALAADTTDVGTISVKGQSLGGGMMVQDDSAKARSTVTKEAMDKLMAYDWPGNIRELRNVVERLIILGGKEISKIDVELFASK